MNLHLTRTFAVASLAFFLCEFASAQLKGAATLKGHVADADSGRPLENAIVFLTNTPIGASTQPDGSFTLDNIPPGDYGLVISRVGYIRQSLHVRLTAGATFSEDIRLVPRPVRTAAVEVRAERSAEARKISTLLFPETSPRSYTLYSFFDSLLPRDAGERSRWEENRIHAYKGSMKHFLHSLYAGSTDAESFTIFSGPLGALLEGRGHRVNAQELSLEPQTGTPFLALRFPGSLRVEYGRRITESYIRNYTAGGLRFQEHVESAGVEDVNSASIVRLNKSYALIDSLGNLLDPLSLDVAGRWMKSRVAELLPMY